MLQLCFGPRDPSYELWFEIWVFWISKLRDNLSYQVNGKLGCYNKNIVQNRIIKK